MRAKTILILGGTSEGAALCHEFHQRFGNQLDLIVSYSGITGQQPDLPATLHVGGFGGAEGLQAFVQEKNVDLVIDATHPYAEIITQNSQFLTDVPVLRYQRPPWQKTQGDNWIDAADMKEAAKRVSQFGSRCFLSIGQKELAHFSSVKDVQFIARMVKQPSNIEWCKVILARGPFQTQDEMDLLKVHNIDVLITKNSGSEMTYGKIAAARALKIPVILVKRPMCKATQQFDSIAKVVSYVTKLCK